VRQLGRLRGGSHGIKLVGTLRSSSSCLRGRLWKKLFEILEQIWSGVEKQCNLSINILDGFLLALVRLQNFQKLFVNLRFVLEAVLRPKVSQAPRL
jgi:hypothetical protein